MSKNCKHKWLPLGNDRWSCKHCAMVKVGYIDQLKQQLAEKDKEIESWKENSKMWENWKETYYKKLTKARQQLQDQRHQICEEIKIKGHYYLNSRGEEYYEITPEILWEIEKGEINESY